MDSNVKNSQDWLFYIGSYSPADKPGIHLAGVNPESGEMKLISSTSGIENPSFLALHQDGRTLYAVTETDEGEAVSYRISPEGQLKELSRENTGGEHPCHIAYSPANVLVTVNYTGGQVSSYLPDAEGAIGKTASRIQHTGSGPNPRRQEKAHPHSAIPDRQGKYVYVSDLGLDRIVIYRLEEGRLVIHKEVSLPPGAGPRHFVIHPSEKWAYGINELNNTVTLYAYHGQEGDLTPLQHISALPEHINRECTAADIHVSLCGRFLYGSNRGFDSIVRFRIDSATGELSEPEWFRSGGAGPRNFALTPNGLLLAANQDSDVIVSFFVDPETGALSETGFTLPVPKPVCIAGWEGLR
ncbi:lactonase family protein [Paenibacillus caui]|uniref:lactonase family protein n=1 Tax=Paenibacillus caui TaxID=2873927 RepID=UPI001CA881E9|nr:lactonase family protein [Paenibacillus caui]